MIERIYFDVENPSNSSVVYEGFREYVLKKFDVPDAKTAKLHYDETLDSYLSRDDDNEVERKRTVIDDYMKNSTDYEFLPIWLQDTVIGYHFKKDDITVKDDVKVRKMTTNQVAGLDKPVIANLAYGNFKHDPNPQVFVMYYDSSHSLFEGFNLRYLNANNLKKLIQLSIKFPNMDMYYFYHIVLKPFSIGKALGLTMKDVRRTSTQTLTKQYHEVSRKYELSPYARYPKQAKDNMIKGKVRPRNAYETDTKEKLKGYQVGNNMLLAYRKYKIEKCHFYNIPTELF